MVKLSGLLEGNTIKTSFKELTVQDLRKIKNHAPREVIAALSDIPQAKILQLDTDQILALYELVSFVEDIEDSLQYIPANIKLPYIDTAAESFEKCELAKMKAQSIKQYYLLLPELIRIYLGEDHLKGSAIECLAKGAVILDNLNSFLERFKELGGDKPNDDEMEAGIEALHSFGTYGIVEGIAQRYHCKPYDVYQWAAEEVYMDMLYQQAKNRYQENLRDIESRKNKSK
jgi:hypothetical protein